MVAQVSIGQRMIDNDPRRRMRDVKIVAVLDNGPAIDQKWAVYFHAGKMHKVRFDRIVEAGEPHHNKYWTLLPVNGTADLP